jgi:hypothetical protein
MNPSSPRRSFIISSSAALAWSLLPRTAAAAAHSAPTGPSGPPFPEAPPVARVAAAPVQTSPSGKTLSPTAVKDYFRNPFLRPVGRAFAPGEQPPSSGAGRSGLGADQVGGHQGSN